MLDQLQLLATCFFLVGSVEWRVRRSIRPGGAALMRSFFWQLSQSARYSSTNNLRGIISIGGSVRITCIHHHYHDFFLIIVTQMVRNTGVPAKGLGVYEENPIPCNVIEKIVRRTPFPADLFLIHYRIIPVGLVPLPGPYFPALGQNIPSFPSYNL